MSEQLGTQTVHEFLEALASKASVPGGGSVAALTGAMAAGLLSMVCAVTLNRKGYEEYADELTSIRSQSEALRAEFEELAQADIQVFTNLSTVYKLPRTTPADAASRKSAIQKLTRQAAEVPLQTARAAARLLPLCTRLANRCGRNIVSDVGVAALLARATVQSALLNVEVNLATLEDQIFVREVRAKVEDLTIGLTDEARGVVEFVRNRINQV
jgi:formiminotetrahydrofolate cyclodeaminase